jgi:hypothetical protein
MPTEDVILLILPSGLAIVNLLIALLIARSKLSRRRKLGWLMVNLLFTVSAWFCAAMPYIIGLADSSASCLGQVGYPGCKRFEELTILFGRTLGNFSILLLLCVLDIVVVAASEYQGRQGKKPVLMT